MEVWEKRGLQGTTDTSRTVVLMSRKELQTLYTIYNFFWKSNRKCYICPQEKKLVQYRQPHLGSSVKTCHANATGRAKK